ncbi:tripartite tricarboxylate transporter substrate-binding protein [Paracraurococcus lichenis]|uniref:Tripartite tricarboxylate transporter substrate-binding protein n=1 Tax=Paracraurococcus lichenis TaxID=3064888 RepID=A0ABT9DZ63_9PROT|nr:tripartite tricarboxylate transporter substrate-binding protein [Paracraurococcus sp. LOR1-02]MDO9709174.1 tripartite tricarboxylate transporter substrate-binding protein [Paracraurococcus sp. LOR1-02]
MTCRIGRRAAFAGTALLLAHRARAASLDRTARFLLGFPPGGASDIVARLLAERLGAYAPQVIVENRPGAAARLAIEAVKIAAPDGATLLFSPESMFGIYPHIYRKTLRYAAEDFIPVSGVTEFGFAFAVPAAHPARTWPDFVAWARQQAEPIPYATPAAGSTPHFWAEQCARAYGIRLGHVAYRGMAPAYPDLYAGRLQAGVTVFGDLLEQRKGGHLRLLAVSMPEPSPKAPEVPAMRSLGHAELVATEQFGVLAPAGTPPALVAGLHAAILAALARPDMREALDRMEQTPLGSTPAEFAARIRAERARWAPIVAATGYTVDE